jgi:hypothetical protein
MAHVNVIKRKNFSINWNAMAIATEAAAADQLSSCAFTFHAATSIQRAQHKF